MPTEVEDIWNGYEALKTLSDQAPNSALATTSKELAYELGRGTRGPLIAYFAELVRNKGKVPPDDEVENLVDSAVEEAMARFIEEAEKTAKYEQPAFQCAREFERAKAEGMHWLLAGLALSTCLAERLLKITVEHKSGD